MNRYGAMAKEHWKRWLPERYGAIPDPDSFFSTLGEEAADQIGNLWPDLANQGGPEPDYLKRVGRLNMAKLQAEEIVLADLVLLDPEPGARADEEEDPDSDLGEMIAIMNDLHREISEVTDPLAPEDWEDQERGHRPEAQ